MKDDDESDKPNTTSDEVAPDASGLTRAAWCGPTEPGHYWYREPCRIYWEIVEVIKISPEFSELALIIGSPGHIYAMPAQLQTGMWGRMLTSQEVDRWITAGR